MFRPSRLYCPPSPELLPFCERLLGDVIQPECSSRSTEAQMPSSSSSSTVQTCEVLPWSCILCGEECMELVTHLLGSQLSTAPLQNLCLRPFRPSWLRPLQCLLLNNLRVCPNGYLPSTGVEPALARTFVKCRQQSQILLRPVRPQLPGYVPDELQLGKHLLFSHSLRSDSCTSKPALWADANALHRLFP